MPTITVMVHAPSAEEGLEWYAKAFPNCVRQQEKPGLFEYIAIEDINLEVVQADSKVASGAAGSVVYWHTNDFDTRLEYLLSLGATLYRGPMTTDCGLRMCQVLDPFGNPLGIRSLPDGKN